MPGSTATLELLVELKVLGQDQLAGFVSVLNLAQQAVSSIVTPAADFEQAMSSIRATAGASVEQLAQLRQTALDLGKATDVGAVSASDAAKAIFELGKAGVDIAEINNGAAKATLQLAAAAGPEFGVANAAMLAADSLNSFKDQGIKAADAANVLVGAANASSIGLNDLKFSLGAVGPVADLIGVSFRDMNVLLAEFGMHGLKGSDAGTSLKTMLLNLSPTSDKATDAMKKLGLITKEGTNLFFDQAGKVKDLGTVSQILQDHLGGLGKEAQTTALKLAFGTDAVRAAAIMAQGGKAEFDKFSDSVTRQGDAASAAGIMSDNLKGKWDALSGTIETMQIALGDKLIPYLSQAVDAINHFISGATFQAWSATVGTAITTAINSLIQLYQWVTTNTPVLVGVLTALGAAFLAVAIPAGIAAAGIIASWALVLAPFVAIGIAAGVLYAAFETNFGSIRDVVNDVWAAIQPVFSAIQDGAELLSNAFSADGLAGVWAALPSALAPAVSALLEFNDNLVNIAGQWTQAAWMWISDAIPPLLSALQEWANNAYYWIIGTGLPTLRDTLAQWAQEAWIWIQNAGPPMLDALATFGENIWTWITGGGLEALVANLAQWAGAAIGWILPQVGPMLGNLAEFLVAITTWIIEGTAALVLQLGLWAAAAVQWILDAIPKLPGALGSWANTILHWIQDAAPKVMGWFTGIGVSIINGVIRGINENASGAVGAIESVINGAIRAINSALGTHMDEIHIKLTEISAAAATAYTGFDASLGMGVDKVTAAVGALSDKSDRAVSSIAQVSAASGTLSDRSDRLAKAIVPVVAAAGALRDRSDQLKGAIDPVTTAVTANYAAIAKIPEVAARAGGAFNTLGNHAADTKKKVGESQKAVEDYVKVLIDGLGQAATSIQGGGSVSASINSMLSLTDEAVKLHMPQIANTIKQWAADAARGVVPSAQAIEATIRQWLTTARQSGNVEMALLAQGVLDNLTKAADAADAQGKKIEDKLTAATSKAKSAMLGDLSTLVTLLNTPDYSVGAAMTDMLKVAQDAADAHLPQVQATVLGWFDAMARGVQLDTTAMTNQITLWLKTATAAGDREGAALLQTYLDKVQQLRDKAGKAAEELAQKTAKAYQDATDKAGKAVQDLADQVQKGFDDAQAAGTKALEALVADADKVAQAFASARQKVAEAVQGMADSIGPAMDQARDALLSGSADLMKNTMDGVTNLPRTILDVMHLAAQAVAAGKPEIAAEFMGLADLLKSGSQVALEHVPEFVIDQYRKMRVGASAEMQLWLDAQIADYEQMAAAAEKKRTAQAGLQAADPGGIADMIAKTLDPLERLKDFQAPTQEAIDAFFAVLDSVVRIFGDKWQSWKGAMTEEAAKVGTDMQAVMGGINAALDPIMKMGDAQKITPEQIEGTFANIWMALHQLNIVMASGELQGDWANKARSFATTLGAIFESINKAIQTVQSSGGKEGQNTNSLTAFIEQLRGAVAALPGIFSADLTPILAKVQSIFGGKETEGSILNLLLRHDEQGFFAVLTHQSEAMLALYRSSIWEAGMDRLIDAVIGKLTQLRNEGAAEARNAGAAIGSALAEGLRSEVSDVASARAELDAAARGGSSGPAPGALPPAQSGPVTGGLRSVGGYA